MSPAWKGRLSPLPALVSLTQPHEDSCQIHSSVGVVRRNSPDGLSLCSGVQFVCRFSDLDTLSHSMEACQVKLYRGELDVADPGLAVADGILTGQVFEGRKQLWCLGSWSTVHPVLLPHYLGSCIK